MTVLFRDGWTDRMRRARQSEDAPPADFGAQATDAPFVISVSGDPTAAAFHRRVSDEGLPLRWVTIEAVAEGRLPIAVLADWIAAAPGVYMRDGWSVDAGDVALRAVVAALCDAHPNVIRAEERSTNWCKPFHVAALAAVPRRVVQLPPTLMTTRHALAGRVIKNCSSAPSFVLDGDTLSGVAEPVLSQARLRGRELRVHVLDGVCFAVEVVTTALDYRKEGGAEMRPAAIDAALAADLCDLTAAEGLRFSGIDLILTGEGPFVIEVNPMPGYHGYDLAPWGEESITTRLYNRLSRAP